MFNRDYQVALKRLFTSANHQNNLINNNNNNQLLHVDVSPQATPHTLVTRLGNAATAVTVAADNTKLLASKE